MSPSRPFPPLVPVTHTRRTLPRCIQPGAQQHVALVNRYEKVVRAERNVAPRGDLWRRPESNADPYSFVYLPAQLQYQLVEQSNGFSNASRRERVSNDTTRDRECKHCCAYSGVLPQVYTGAVAASLATRTPVVFARRRCDFGRQ